MRRTDSARTTGQGGLISLEPQHLAWDRNGGTVTGTVVLELLTLVQEADGDTAMQNAVATALRSLLSHTSTVAPGLAQI
jgi:hypothetical protein